MATSTPQVRIIYDRRKRASSTVKGTVEIEVASNGDRLRLSTGVSVLRQQWKGGSVINHPKALELNQQIRDMYDDIFDRLTTMVKAGVIDLNLLKGTRKRAVDESNDFLAWLEKRIMLRGVTESTRRQHLVMHRCLKEFGQIRTFEDLTTRNIKLWDDYIRTKVTAQSSVHGYHKRLKPYIQEALQLNLIARNPYETMRIPRGRSEGIKFLTEEERDRIAALECYGPVEKVRDMFIFACYTGLSYSDLVKIRKEDIIKQGDDYCIKDKRLKTNVPYTIVLLPQAMDIHEITFATTLSQHSLILQRKNQTRPGAQLKTSKNFKFMTYVSNIFNSSLNSNRKLKYFSVEVITFDGESFIEEVEARSAEEAQEIAASGYDNVDYTMVQGCFAGW